MIDAERTPNPNSLKFTTEQGPFSENGIVAISSPDETGRHPLGPHLFEIDGVADVFITPDFVTVSKEDRASWDDVKPSIEDALTTYLHDTGEDQT
jgi:hypothetical protein